MKTKKLTEKEAWLLIAEAFDKPKGAPIFTEEDYVEEFFDEFDLPYDNENFTDSGLCCCIEFFRTFRLNKIESEIADSMRNKIHNHREEHDLKEYFYPFTDEGRKQRANLARKFAEECE